MSRRESNADWVEVPVEQLGLDRWPHYWCEGPVTVWCDGQGSVGVFATGPQRTRDTERVQRAWEVLGARAPWSSVHVDAAAFGDDPAALTEVLAYHPRFAGSSARGAGRITLVLPSDWSSAWWMGIATMASSHGLPIVVVQDAGKAWQGTDPLLARRVIQLEASLRADAALTRRLEERLEADPTLSVENAARALGCSPRTLQRVLAGSGDTFLALRSAARLALARRLLHSTDDKLSTIATRVGFSSRSHFVMWFRDATGEAPSTYRRAPRLPG